MDYLLTHHDIKIDTQDDEGNTTLHYAIKNNDHDVINQLLDMQQESSQESIKNIINIQNKKGKNMFGWQQDRESRQLVRQ